MPGRQLLVLGALAALAVVSGGLALVLGPSGADLVGRQTAGGTAGSTTAPATTVALHPVTSGTPVATTAAPAAPAPPSTTTTVLAPAVGADGAFLQSPANATARRVDRSVGCSSAVEPGWKIAQCGALRTQGMVLLWLVESRGQGRRVQILRERTAGEWAPVLAWADDAGVSVAAVGVRGEDVSGDGEPELLFGYRRRDAARTLAVDLVEAPGRVTVHRELPHGSVRAVKGEWHTWEATGDVFRRATLRFVSGAWREVAVATVPPDGVPPSMV